MSNAIGSVTKTLFGGSESKSRSSSQMDPRLMQSFLDNYNRATGVAENLGPRQFAGFTPLFNQGVDWLQNAVVDQAGGLALGAAQNPTSVSAQSFLQGDISQYMNPYTDQVVDRAMSDLDRQRLLAQQGIGDQAAAARAFGGSRHGVAEAETNRAFADVAANTAAQLRDQGFRTGADLMTRDMDRGLQAGLANQAAGLQGIGLLGNLGLQGADALTSLGLLQQGFSQQQLDAIRNLPLEQQQIINQALGIAPAGGAGTVSTATQTASSSPGLLGGLGQFWGNIG
jgi:hypothetical protein